MSGRSLIFVCLLCVLQLTSSRSLRQAKRVFDANFLDDQRYAIDDCVPLAFGDFNADKIIDVFCRSTGGRTLRVMLNDARSTRVVEQCRVELPRGEIFDLIAADFDADSRLDLFVLYKNSAEQRDFSGGFFWGNRTSLSETNRILRSFVRSFVCRLGDLQPLNISFQSSPTALE